ncbi:uncharacterized protein LOC106066812 isoform X2 [Biomphalaria glabrata]|uniref:Uncharacterized protein LOC106066812 isoform X2 n=1 Tax=Biomphalaria glabrata TaxID=6526 RepID=A0A9W3AKM1_BIOGL|nr:uncharacterized protein LOC106066812 isoform X2 [Biomphalaria glabrata]
MTKLDQQKTHRHDVETDLLTDAHHKTKTTQHGADVLVLDSVHSWIICFAMLVTALLVPKTGERVTCIIGSILGSVCTIAIGASPNIACFLVFMALKGVSTGTTAVASIAMISQYFDKRKSFATAVACSGLALGSMGAPPAATYFIEVYGKRGAFLLLGALEMNNICMSILLRPTSRYTHIVKSDEGMDGRPNVENQAELQKELEGNTDDIQDGGTNTDALLDTNSDQDMNLKHKQTSIVDKNHAAQTTNHDVNRANQTNVKSPEEILLKPQGQESFSKFNDSGNILTHNECDAESEHLNLDIWRKNSRPSRSISIEINGKCFHHDATSFSRSNSNMTSVRERLNSYDSHYKYFQPDRLNIASTWSIISTPVSDVLVGFEICTLQENPCLSDQGSTDMRNKSCLMRFLMWLHDAFNIHLFQSWSLRALLLYNITAVLVLYLSTYFPTIGAKAGLAQDDIALMLIISGGVDFISRLAIGAFTDLHILTTTQIVAIAQAIIGTTCHFTHFYTSFESLMVLAVIIGLFGGLRQSLGTLICLQFMGKERYVQALGFQTMVSTLTMAVHHPLLSSIMELSGSFNTSLHYVGVAAYLSVFILLLEPLTKKLDAKKNLQENET